MAGLPLARLASGTHARRSWAFPAVTGSQASPASKRQELCESGLPDADACGADWEQEGAEPAERFRAGILSEAYSRGRWLLGLLVLQSVSSLVLDQYQPLLKEHLVVTLFLTTCVGAGGNAGNQSAIKVIRGLATGALSRESLLPTLRQQSVVGLLLATGLAAGGFVRVFITNGHVMDAVAIAASLWLVVLTSVTVGTALPFGLARAGVDPANAGTSIQVIMDICGCVITCFCCDLLLRQLSGTLL